MTVENLSFDDYVARPGVNASAIKAGLSSPKEMHYYIENGKADNRSMSFGRKGHIWLLQYDERWDLCAEYTGPTSGKGSQKEWDAFKEANPDKECIKPDEIRKLDEMRECVMGIQHVAYYLNNCAREVSITWKETFGDAKARLDLMGTEEILDVKFVQKRWIKRDEGKAFARGIRQDPHFGDIQLGYYGNGFKAEFGRTPKCGFVGIQNAKPWDAAIYWMDDVWVRNGAERAHEVACLYKACALSGRYMGAQDAPETIYEPDFSKGEKEEDISEGKAGEGETL